MAGQEGATHGRGDEVGYAVVVREVGAEGGALVFACGSKVGIGYLVVDL